MSQDVAPLKISEERLDPKQVLELMDLTSPIDQMQLPQQPKKEPKDVMKPEEGKKTLEAYERDRRIQNQLRR